MPEMKLDAVDAAELAELLQFLSQWLARDAARLGGSLAQFVGHPAYGLAQLRDDLQRFVFLLGGSTARPCSAPTRHSEAPVTVTSPLRGPENSEGGGFAAADSLRRTAGLQARSGI